MNLPQAFLDEIRDRVSLAQVVGRKVTWDPRKSNAARGDYWSPCPFHQEKTASFHVDDVKGYYYCFGCQAKGNVFSFLRDSENMGFMEAVELLAGQAGLAMPARDPAAAARAEEAKGLAEAMEAAVQFYRLQLNSARATEARTYLEGRDLSPAAIERFEIGFAPEGRTVLIEHLRGKGFSMERIVEAGLAGKPRDGGSPYDRFRGRIMFPIRDTRGRAIAFGARAIRPGQEPKYLNSPETPLFDKGANLYNVGPARTAAKKCGQLVIVEGYMDVIALAQAGIDHAVAPLGTAITETQLRKLWDLCPEPVVALDGDKAGMGAAHRLISLALPLLEAGKALRFVILPADSDPDDIVRLGGAKAMEEVLAKSLPMIDLIWTKETEGHPLDSPERRAALDQRLRQRIEAIADERLRAHYWSEIKTRRATLFAPKREAGRPRGQMPGRGPARRGAPRWSPPAAPRPETLASLLGAGAAGALAESRIRECAILAGCIAHPELAAEFEDRLERIAFTCDDLEKIRDALLSCVDESLSHPNPTEWIGTAIGRRIGRDPYTELFAPGQVRANRHLSRDATPEQARRAIDEELTRHAAILGRLSETSEAEREISEAEDDGVAWRLSQAAQARFEADTRPLAEHAGTSTQDEMSLSLELDQMIERHKSRPKKNR
ncbi:DNA primase [Amaricoccus macauensis]|uniref:DNA primase n=1 Tax=Amaricoccus macauensis TaxID=57001 RepID=UPI003C7AD33A